MVKVSAVLLDVIPVPVDSPVPTGLASAKSSTNNTSPVVQQMVSEDDLYMEAMVVTDPDFRDCVIGGPTAAPLGSAGVIVNIAGDVTVSVSSPTELAGDVTPCWRLTVGVSYPADIAGGVVTVSVAPSAVAEVASSADIAEVAPSADLAEVASSADLAGDVTVGVSTPADLHGGVTVGVATSAIAEVSSSADIAEV